jgi:hypothetical protein
MLNDQLKKRRIPTKEYMKNGMRRNRKKTHPSKEGTEGCAKMEPLSCEACRIKKKFSPAFTAAKVVESSVVLIDTGCLLPGD